MSRSAWTHTLCVACYAEEEPGRHPVTVPDSDEEACCLCGVFTESGIFYRQNPALYRCVGQHSEDQ